MSEPERLAVIEAGTKGIRLLVVERRDPPEAMRVLQSGGQLGDLGAGLEENAGRMLAENVRRSGQFVRQFFDTARGLGAGRIVLVGTEVFRRAANVDEFCERLPSSLALRVLTSEEEAVGSFLAACWGFRETFGAGGRVVVLDLGGGSLEVVGGLQGWPPRPVAGISLRGLGTFTLRDLWRRTDPARREDELRRHIDADIGRHAADLTVFRPADGEEPGGEGRLLVAGLGSTVTDSAWFLAGHRRNNFRSEKVHGLRAGVADLERLRREMRGTGGVAAGWGFKDPLGHQLGLAALLAVLRSLGMPTIAACGTGLRFGLAYAFLHDLPLSLTGAAPEPPREKTPDPPAPPQPAAAPVLLLPAPESVKPAPPADPAPDAALKAELEALSEPDRKALTKAVGVKGRGPALVEKLLAVGADEVRRHLRALRRDYARRKSPDLLAECERRRLPVVRKATKEALIRVLEESDQIADRLCDPEPVGDAARAAALLQERGRLPWPSVEAVLRRLGKDLAQRAARGETLGSGAVPELLAWGLGGPAPAWEGHRTVDTARIGPDFVVAPECLGMYGGRRGPATDVYVLGELALALLAGRLVADPEERDAWVARAVVNLRALLPSAPLGLAALLGRALAADPAERLAAPADFLRGLDRLRAVDAGPPDAPAGWAAAAESHHGILRAANLGRHNSENADGTFIRLGPGGDWAVLALADGVSRCTVGTPQGAKDAYLAAVEDDFLPLHLPALLGGAPAPSVLLHLRSFLMGEANARVIEVSRKALAAAPADGAPLDPASVSALLGVLCDGTFYAGGLGDCRAYLVNETIGDRLSVDGTPSVLSLRDPAGAGSAAFDHRLALVLGNARYDAEAGLVAEPPQAVFLTRCTLWPGDCLVMATDGLYRGFRDEEALLGRVRDLVIREQRPLPEAAFELMAEANRRYGKDNLSVILCRAGDARPRTG